MENKHNFMETESITKLLIKFSIPAIVGMFVNALYNVVDRIYIGNIKGTGHLGITGVGLVFPVVILIFAFSLLIGIGSAASVSLKLGMKDREEAERFLGVAVFLSLVISAILMIIIYFNMDRIIYFIGGSDKTFTYAKNYLFYINLGVPAAILGLVLNSVIRSDGSPKIAMGTLLIGAITNIVLDPIFIFMFGMGVKGAAIATIISQYVSMFWTIHYFKSKRSKIKLIKKDIVFNYHKAKEICLLGSSAFAIQLGFSLVTYILNTVLKKYGGDTSIGAMAIVQSFMTFMAMPIFGINQGIQPILGYNYGAEKYKRVKEALYKGIFAATIICIIGYTSVRLFSNTLIQIFTTKPELQEITKYGLRAYTMVFPIVGFQIVSSIYFQAVGKPRMSFFISLSRQIIVMIPCLIILPIFFGLNGIWYAAPTADSIATLITFILVRKEIKKLDKLEEMLEKRDV
ncbi:MATE family efflux transporter [Fusobacterium polymorphum]|uniref:Multidrug export protein MepA n=1 Tax=Fusobacterium nucleatum subsp. polymorphum TaxID=76857 RepID=A0AAC8WGQ4_FUSNP|nr:MATE family efflux transporter [Fusobacterium polymorphum]ALM94755.1 MATE family efflux transporter [Fusobacterium polymorphum]